MSRGEVIRLHGEPHQHIRALLPWYVTGRLDEMEHARVAAHLAACAECREALGFERRLEAEVAGASPEIEQGWQAMMRRVESAGAGRGSMARPAGWAGKARGLAPWLLLGLTAQVLLLALFVTAPRLSPGYHALAAPAPQRPGNVVVMFRPDASARSMTEALTAVHARLTDGPTGADAYVLRVPAAERAAALAKLRASRAVVLAEPVDGGAPS